MLRFYFLFTFLIYSLFIFSSPVQQSDSSLLKILADEYLSSRKYDSAAIYYKAAATEYHKLQDIKQYLYCKNQEAFSLGIQNKNRESLAICERIIEDYPDSLKTYRYDVYFYWKIALSNLRLGNYNKAYNYGIRTMEVAELYSIFEGYMLNDILEILIMSARNIGLYDIALGHAFERMEYAQLNSDYLNLSHAYNSIGLIYKRLHNKDRAFEYFNKSLELRKAHAPQWAPYVATNIGEMYQQFGPIDSALTWFQNSLTMLKKQGVRENLLYSAIYSSISVLNRKMADYDSAEIYIDKCLDIRSRYYNSADIQFNDFLLVKADILIGSGQLTSAFQILEQLNEFYLDDRFSPEDRARYHSGMAYFHRASGSNNEAVLQYQKAIIVLSRDFNDLDIFSLPKNDDLFYGKDKLIKAVTRKTSLINEMYNETGDLKYLRSVVDHYNFSVQLIRMMIDDQNGLASISNLYKDYRHLYETAIKASVSLNNLDFDEINYSRISSYMEASRMNHAKILYRLNQQINFGGIPDSVINRKNELESLVAASLSDSITDPKILSERFRMEQELDRIQVLLKNEERNNNLVESDDFDLLMQAKRKLKGKGLILQYYFGEDNLYLLASGRKSNRLMVLPWTSREKENLDKFIAYLKKPGSTESIDELNRRVFQSLGLDSILNEGISEVVIIPDRELYFVPFDALLDNKNDLLISKYTIYTENSLFFMNSVRKKVRSKFILLGLAPFSELETGPSVQSSINRSGGKKYYPLPGSKDEVETIQELIGGIAKTGSSATETFFRENAGNSEIIHISSHSYLDDNDPLFSSIIFAPGTGKEDGELYIHEIYGLNLGADLVTLSACNTGIGSYLDGEGMISLANGFRSAGVQNIVMSLWNLPDDATSEVMISFYSYLKDGEKKADALRMAKLDYLAGADRNASAPYFWAASVYSGTNSQLPFKKRYHSLYVVLFVGLILLGFMAWQIKRRKSAVKSVS